MISELPLLRYALLGGILPFLHTKGIHIHTLPPIFSEWERITRENDIGEV